MQITAVVLAYNEAEALRVTLPAIREAVSEVVIVDMGSTDGSSELYQPSDLVVPYDRRSLMNFGFSHPRNYGAQHASGDWIFAIDADELIEPDEFRRATAGLAPMVTSLERRTYTEAPGFDINEPAALIAEAPHTTERQRRLYPNLPAYRWEGLIHEEVRVAAEPAQAVQDVESTLHHLVFYKKTLNLNEKQEMYAHLLLKGLVYPGFRHGTNPWFFADYIPPLLRTLTWQANNFAARNNLMTFDYDELNARYGAAA